MSRKGSEVSLFAGHGTGQIAPGHGGSPLQGEPTPSVPIVPPQMSRLNVPVSVHGTACLLQRSGGGYVMRGPDGAVVAEAPSRFLVVALAAHNLAPARAFAQGA